MQSSPNEELNMVKSARFLAIRKALGLNQSEMAERLATSQSAVGRYENAKLNIGPYVEHKILSELNVNPVWWNTGQGEIFLSSDAKAKHRIIENDSLVHEELTYINTKARASFTELGNVTMDHETYWVLKSSPYDNYKDQVIIEIDGDSMEPNYWDGCKVRCKEVRQGDWVYLNSGVYAVAYGNFFVVKRVKNSPSDGVLKLHSDNTDTGGSIEVPLEKVRKIWRVLRIVDAPAR